MSLATAADSDRIDLRAFRANGSVSEDEYERIASKLQDKLDGFRVPSIRKGLALTPVDFDTYAEESRANYDRQYAPIIDPEMGVEMNVVIVAFQAQFSMSFFPNFSREYFDLMRLDSISFADVAIEVTEQGYSLVPTSQFRSLLLAAHQIEQEVRARYAETSLSRSVAGTIGVETKFFVPMNVDSFNPTENMSIQVEISLYPDD